MDITLIKSIYIYLIGIVAFIAVDFVWLAKIAPKFYKDNIGHLMAEKPNLIAAGLFYLIFIAGMLVFVIIPALNKDSLSHAVGYGAFFGLVCYATFDLTSQAVFKNWPTKVTITDLIWGMVLTATVSAIVFAIAKKFIV